MDITLYELVRIPLYFTGWKPGTRMEDVPVERHKVMQTIEGKERAEAALQVLNEFSRMMKDPPHHYLRQVSQGQYPAHLAKLAA